MNTHIECAYLTRSRHMHIVSAAGETDATTLTQTAASRRLAHRQRTRYALPTSSQERIVRYLIIILLFVAAACGDDTQTKTDQDMGTSVDADTSALDEVRRRNDTSEVGPGSCGHVCMPDEFCDTHGYWVASGDSVSWVEACRGEPRPFGCEFEACPLAETN